MMICIQVYSTMGKVKTFDLVKTSELNNFFFVVTTNNFALNYDISSQIYFCVKCQAKKRLSESCRNKSRLKYEETLRVACIEMQSTPVILTSLISNIRLSTNENLVPV